MRQLDRQGSDRFVEFVLEIGIHSRRQFLIFRSRDHTPPLEPINEVIMDAPSILFRRPGDRVSEPSDGYSHRASSRISDGPI